MKIIRVKLLSLFRISKKIKSNRILHWCTNGNSPPVLFVWGSWFSSLKCFVCLRNISCVQCCTCLWMVHSGFPFWFPLTFTPFTVFGILWYRVVLCPALKTKTQWCTYIIYTHCYVIPMFCRVLGYRWNGRGKQLWPFT